GSIAAEIPAKLLAEEAPLYSREAKPPSPVAAVYDRRINELPKIDNHEALRQLLRDPTIASKNWVYRQYDHTVRTGTVVKPGSDAAVFLVRYANKIVAATTDCNSLYCALDPREGGKIAVAEAARNLTCSGGRPLAVTDPTPTIAMVGLIDKEEYITTQWFKDEGDVIILVGTVAGIGDAGTGIIDPGSSLGGSRYLKVCHGLKIGPAPRIDLTHEMNVQNSIRDLIHAGLVKSAHDCSEGGLAVALAECCLNPERLFGAEIRLNAGDTPATTALFNESQSRIVISVAAEDLAATVTILREREAPFQRSEEH